MSVSAAHLGRRRVVTSLLIFTWPAAAPGPGYMVRRRKFPVHLNERRHFALG